MVFILRGRVLLVLLTGSYVTFLSVWSDRRESTEALRSGDAARILLADFRAKSETSSGENDGPSLLERGPKAPSLRRMGMTRSETRKYELVRTNLRAGTALAASR